MPKAGNFKFDFIAKSIGIHFFEFEDMFRCYRDNENLKKHFGHMDTLKEWMKSVGSHVYWCASSIKQGFENLILAKWNSMRHVAN